MSRGERLVFILKPFAVWAFSVGLGIYVLILHIMGTANLIG